jgi:glycosyltransferase involved in cell wall biosynthesis
MRILFLGLHRPGRSPSQRYRFEQYLPYLQQQGFECRQAWVIDAPDDAPFYAPGHYWHKLGVLQKGLERNLGHVVRANEYDAIFVQREAFMLGTALFERAMALGAPLVFDFDDAIWLPNVSEGNRALAFLKRPQKTNTLIRTARLVLAGNAYLAAYARQFNPRVHVVPSTIDTTLYHPIPPRPPGAPVTIGWSGSLSTIPHFELALPALQEVHRRYGDRVRFRVIGHGTYHIPALPVESLAWRAQTEVQDLAALDVGIMPLPNEEWARGKCGMKGLQYMGMGIATVMSPVGTNAEIVQPGHNGLLPATHDEWVQALCQLVEDAPMRLRLGQAGRQTVVERYSLQSQQARVAALLRSVAVGG